MLHSTEVLCSISNNDYLNLNIHRHYTHRTQEDNDKAIKILLDKINDPEKINWHPRFYKTLAGYDITLIRWMSVDVDAHQVGEGLLLYRGITHIVLDV